MPISGIDPYSAVPQPPEYGVGVEDIAEERPPEETEAIESVEEPPPEPPPEAPPAANTPPPEAPVEEYKGRYVDTYA